jgi:hypothetical protein
MLRSLLASLCLVAALALAGAPKPAAAQAKVVGSGSPSSCTRAALATALAGGGSISFNCGAAPATIVIDAALDISAPETTIDGGGTITLSGNGASRIIEHRSFGLIGSSALTLKNITLARGHTSGDGSSAAGAYAANGAAVRSIFQAANSSFKPTLRALNVIFRDNDASLSSVPGGRDAYDYGGGAIYSQGGFVEISGSQFIDNDAANGAGGAIHILQSGLTIADSSFSNNTALGARPQDSVGGAISIDGLGGPSGVFSVSGSSFSGNRSYNSGGAIHLNMYDDGNTAAISASSFVDNAVVGGTRAQGGAIGGGGTGGNPQISIGASLFSGNSAKKTAGAGSAVEDGSGGALAFPQRARLSIENSSFYRNTAYGTGYNANGGALYVVNNTDQFSVASSTFAENSAGWVGGAISNSGVGGGPGGRLRNTIFAYNTAGGIANFQQHCSAELQEDGPNLQYPPRLTNGNYYNDATCFVGKSAPSQTGLPAFRDPQLGPLADNGGPTRTLAIGAGSPAFNAGTGCPASDQRGVARPQAGSCDIGAYELVLGLQVSRPLIAQGSADRSLLVFGYGFTSASVVQVGGAPRPTTLLDGQTLRAELSAGDLSGLGSLTISIGGPGAGLEPASVRVVAQLSQLFLPLTMR